MAHYRGFKHLGTPASHWVLVTGVPRSGTTFVGKVLSHGRDRDYFHEPMNPMCGVPAVRQPFVVLGDHQGSAHPEVQAELMALSLYAPLLRSNSFIHDTTSRRFAKVFVGSRGPYMLRLARWNPWSRTAVVKDPFACFSIPWFVQHLSARCVAIVRHPVAVAASFQRLGWTATSLLNSLRVQQNQLEDLPNEDRLLLERTDLSEAQSIGLAWRLVVNELHLRSEAGQALLVQHEDLSASPVGTFERIFSYCNLVLDDSTRSFIRQSTESGNRVEAGRGRVQDFSRDSKLLLSHRLNSVDASFAAEVMATAGPIASELYG